MECTLSDAESCRATVAVESEPDRHPDPLREIVRAVAELNLAADGRIVEPEALDRAIEAMLAVELPTPKRQYAQRLKKTGL